MYACLIFGLVGGKNRADFPDQVPRSAHIILGRFILFKQRGVVALTTVSRVWRKESWLAALAGWRNSGSILHSIELLEFGQDFCGLWRSIHAMSLLFFRHQFGEDRVVLERRGIADLVAPRGNIT